MRNLTMNKMTKQTFAVVTGLSLFMSAQAFATSSQANGQMITEVEKESYSIGASLGKYVSGQIHNQLQLGAEVEMNLVVKGVLDALKGELQYSDEQILTYLNQRSEWLNAARDAETERLSQQNIAASEQYLAANEAKAGVSVTSSGLQYEVITTGEGRLPNPEDVVTVHYKGLLIDGTEFDNSYEREEPNRFAIMSVIDGWQEGIQLMPEGSTYKLTIPAELAYGKEQVGIIPPSSTLIFEVELVKVEAPSENSHGMGLSLPSMSGMGMGGMMGGH